MEVDVDPSSVRQHRRSATGGLRPDDLDEFDDDDEELNHNNDFDLDDDDDEFDEDDIDDVDEIEFDDPEVELHDDLLDDEYRPLKKRKLTRAGSSVTTKRGKKPKANYYSVRGRTRGASAEMNQLRARLQVYRRSRVVTTSMTDVITTMNATLIAKLIHILGGGPSVIASQQQQQPNSFSLESLALMLPDEDPFKAQLRELSNQYMEASANKMVVDQELAALDVDDNLLVDVRSNGVTTKKRGRKPRTIGDNSPKKATTKSTTATATSTAPKRRGRRKKNADGTRMSGMLLCLLL